MVLCTSNGREQAEDDEFPMRLSDFVLQTVNDVMVKDGLAWHYKQFDNTQSYAAAEIDARRAKRGLWRDPAPIPPFIFRRTKNRFRPHRDLTMAR